MKRRRICVVSGSRADYGILFPILCELKTSPKIDLQLIVTGSHLSPEFGLTVKEIEADGFEIAKKVEILVSSDTDVGVAKSMGLGLIEFGPVLNDLSPDIVMLLGDRFELMAVAATALVLAIPIAHIHGGETTRAAFDEAIRHSITKMAHIHFTATEEYRRRVIQLGESPDRVFNVGAPGLDNIRALDPVSRQELEHLLGLSFDRRTILVTWHPVTLEPGTSVVDFGEILTALDRNPGLNVIFTKANSDNEGREINQAIDEFVKKNSVRAVVVASMGRRMYWSVLMNIDCVLGNSSSGIIEAPSAGVPTINIGARQEGRIRASSVVDCPPVAVDIEKAITAVMSDECDCAIDRTANPYDQGGASKLISEAVSSVDTTALIKKHFYDLPRSD